MRILVTGGAGYIGSHVVLELTQLGHEIIVLDTLDSGNHVNLFSENQFIQGNILDNSVLDSIFSKKIDTVFHFAAWKAAGESMTSPEKYTINNINGTMNLLSKMTQYGCKHFIFASTAAVYGDPVYLPVDENHFLKPLNYYGYTKLCIEENLKWFEQLRGVKYACLRFFNAAGYQSDGKITGIERTTANLLPIMFDTVIKRRDSFEIFGTDYDTPDGTCIRDYIHVSDLARALVLSFKYITTQNQSVTLNLGSEKGYSVKEVVDEVEKVVGRKIKYKFGKRRDGDPPKLLASSLKAKSILNWTPIQSDIHSIVQSMWNLYSRLK